MQGGQRIDHNGGQIGARRNGMSMRAALAAGNLDQRPVRNRRRLRQEERGNIDRLRADEGTHRLRQRPDAGKRGDGLTARLFAGAFIKRAEQFGELSQFDPGGLAERFEAGHRRHQDHVSLANGMRLLQLSEPVQHGHT